jgi:hypothetical protein
MTAYSMAANKPAAAKLSPVPAYCVNAAAAALVLLALTDADDEAAEVVALDVEFDEVVEVLLSQEAWLGTVTPAVEQIFWAKATVATERYVNKEWVERGERNVLAWSAGLQFLLMQQERFAIHPLLEQIHPMSYWLHPATLRLPTQVDWKQLVWLRSWRMVKMETYCASGDIS